MSKTNVPIDELYQQAKSGSRLALGRLLTKVERGGAAADAISELAHPDAGQAHILGITGSPGAGKSTLVGQLVGQLLEAGRRPAVLAVDPSSPLTGGAILGDRIRMDEVVEPGEEKATAFIRSMATRGHSGGLALAVPLAVRLFDALDYDPVIIETVGVGQVEVDVVGAADTAVVVATPGMGDAVQANKAGLLEVADIFVVNKADRPGATDVRRDLELMLDLSKVTGQAAEVGYRPPIVMASALEGTGSDEILTAIADHLEFLESSGRRLVRRQHRVRTEIRARMEQALAADVEAILRSPEGVDLIVDVDVGKATPTSVTRQLLAKLRSVEPEAE